MWRTKVHCILSPSSQPTCAHQDNATHLQTDTFLLTITHSVSMFTLFLTHTMPCFSPALWQYSSISINLPPFFFHTFCPFSERLFYLIPPSHCRAPMLHVLPFPGSPYPSGAAPQSHRWLQQEEGGQRTIICEPNLHTVASCGFLTTKFVIYSFQTFSYMHCG